MHAIGDYCLQSDWMAQGKVKSWFPAFCHALVYSLGFLLFRPSIAAWLVIFGTHYLIDRYRLARYVVWAKNAMAPPTWWKQSKNGAWSGSSNQVAAMWRTWIDSGIPLERPGELDDILTMKKARVLPFSVCAGTGYPPDRPAWLAVWLLIFADNVIHICVNGAALKWL
jgi:hypothetical protein